MKDHKLAVPMSWMVEDALDGRVAVGRSRTGDVNVYHDLRLSERMIYQLQKFLEEEFSNGGDPFRVRWLVMTHELIRRAVAEAREREEQPRRARLESATKRGENETH